MSSILFHGNIYIIGWNNQAFYKYSPSTDQWTQLTDSPYQVGACAFGIINDLIYGVGGNNGGGSIASYKSIIVYDITNNSWLIDAQELKSKRHWMATAEYEGGLYVVGGIDSTAQSVNIVEEIVAQGTEGINEETASSKGYSLGQNYPDPCITTTRISYSLPASTYTTLKVYDIMGIEIATLVNEMKSSGNYAVDFDLNKLKAGTYFYRLQAGKFIQTKKLLIYK
jgi:hypothetical protein